MTMYNLSDESGGFQKTRKPKRYDWDEKPVKDKNKKKDYTDQRKTKRGEIEYQTEKY